MDGENRLDERGQDPLGQLEALQRALMLDPSYSRRARQHFDRQIYPANVLGDFENFSTAVHRGLLPPADVLMRIADGLTKYLEGETGVTLDRCFGLRSVVRAGTPAERQRRDRERGMLLYAMAEKRAANPRERLETIAIKVLNEYRITTLSEGSLKSYYKKEKMGVVAKWIRQRRQRDKIFP